MRSIYYPEASFHLIGGLGSGMKAWSGVKWSVVAQSCPTLCDTMDCSIKPRKSAKIYNSDSFNLILEMTKKKISTSVDLIAVIFNKHWEPAVFNTIGHCRYNRIKIDMNSPLLSLLRTLQTQIWGQTYSEKIGEVLRVSRWIE